MITPLKLSFDGFLMTTWEREVKNQRKKEPQSPCLIAHPHHTLAIVPLSTTISWPEPLTQVAVLSSDNEQEVYTLLALQIRFEAKSKEIIDKI